MAPPDGGRDSFPEEKPPPLPSPWLRANISSARVDITSVPELQLPGEHQPGEQRPGEQVSGEQGLGESGPGEQSVGEQGPGEWARIQSRVALWDADKRQMDARTSFAFPKPIRRTDQVYVMGLNLAGRYIAHTLAGCGTIPPVRYIQPTPKNYREWCLSGKQLTLYRGDTAIIRNRVRAWPIFAEQGAAAEEEVIDNLIVTLPACQVVRALGPIRHQLDHRSTICLVQDGLGVAEALIEAYFPDPLRRPVFLLGHFTPSLGHTDRPFSVAEIRPGRLYLTVLSPTEGEASQRARIKHHPPLERTVRSTQLIRLLTSIPGLNATGHPMHDFFGYKLPTMAFRAVVDPLAALLDCRYDELAENRYARQLMDQLVGELAHVVSLLPECRGSSKFWEAALSSSLRDAVVHQTKMQRKADSIMRAHVSRGWDSDLDFLSGYFVRRARDVRARVATLNSILWSVKAKRAAALKKQDDEVPFESSD